MTASRPPASRPGVTIIPIHGQTPKIHDSAFIAPGCTIIGNVEIGADSSVWYNCVLRADVSRIVIGERTISRMAVSAIAIRSARATLTDRR